MGKFIIIMIAAVAVIGVSIITFSGQSETEKERKATERFFGQKSVNTNSQKEF